ncbi:MAG: hypothetical protein QW390_02980 [Candidatus Bathyarchaeia archaeon]
MSHVRLDKTKKASILLTAIGGCLIIAGSGYFFYLTQSYLQNVPPVVVRTGAFYMILLIIPATGIISGGIIGNLYRQNRLGAFLALGFSLISAFLGINQLIIIGAVFGIVGGGLMLCRR